MCTNFLRHTCRQTFLENICLSVGLYVCMPPKFCEHCISRSNARKLMKLYIQLHLDTIWCWLYLGAYRSRSSAVVRNFWVFYHNGIGQNCVQLYLILIILRQAFWNSIFLVVSSRQGPRGLVVSALWFNSSVEGKRTDLITAKPW